MRSVLFLCLIAALNAPAFAQGGVPAEAGRLVPVDAVGVVVVPSFARMETIVSQVLAHFGQPAEMAQGMIAGLKSDEGPMGPVGPLADLLDGDAPMIVTIAMPEGGGMAAPDIAIIVKVSDVAAAAERIPGTASGSWFGFSPINSEPVLSPESSALLNGIDGDQLTVRLNLAPVMAAYGGFLIGGIEMGASQIPMDNVQGVDKDAIIEGIIAGTEAFVASADRLEWTLKFDGAQLDHRLSLTWLKESPLARMGAEKPAIAAQALAGMLAKDYMISVVGSYDVRGLMTFYAQLMDFTLKSPGATVGMPLDQESLVDYLDAVKEILQSTTTAGAMGVDLEVGKVLVDFIMQTTHGAKYLHSASRAASAYQKMMESIGLELKTAVVKKETGTELTVELSERADSEGAADRESPKGIAEKVLGSNFSLTGFAADKLVAMSYGGPNAPKARSMAARMSVPGAAPKELAKALALGGQNAQFAMAMDLGALTKGITGILRVIPDALENIPDYSKLQSARIWVGMGNSPMGFTMGAKVDLKGLGAIAKAAMN